MFKFFLLFSTLLITTLDLAGNEVIRKTVEIKPEQFLSEDKFSYYDDKVTIRFNLVKGKESSNFCFFLLSGTTSRKEILSLMLDGEERRRELNFFYAKNMQLRKQVIQVDSLFFQAERCPIFIELDTRKNRLKLAVAANDTIEMTQAGLSPDDGYKFAIHLDTLPIMNHIHASQQLAIEDFRIEALQDSRKASSIIWYIIIIILDVLIFAFMYYRHRKQKELNNSNITEVPLSSSIYLNKPLLPTKSAIYLFGGMHIYNKEGEDIAKKFSPILKELLALLIVHTDKKGISADKMKAYLWADKTVASARNNRAVNLGKLRNLLAEVGEFEIKSDDGYWSIQSTNAFIDYIQYRTTLKTPGLLSRADIELLCSITAEGNILPEQHYEWLDELKGTISDELFDKFLAYAATMNENQSTDVYIGIADVMFKFETINEQALSLKCRAYVKSGRHSAAKTFYDKFCEEYKQVYGEFFETSFADILKMTD